MLLSVCSRCWLQHHRNISSAAYLEKISNVLTNESKEQCIETSRKVAEVYNKTYSNAWSNRKKNAAVLIALCEVDETPSVLFTVRSQAVRLNRGHVSFPGGTVDREDKSLEDAALRECEEEIGFPQKNIDVWTMLPPLPDKSGTISVYGVIGNLGKIDLKDLKPNHDEVSDVFTVPIHFLCDPSNIRYTKFRVSSTSPAKVDYTMPVFTSSPIVWGLTACCLDLALYCLFPHDYQIVSRTHRMKQILPPNT